MEPMRMRLWIASRVTPSLSAASVTLSRSTESSSDTPHTLVYSHGCRVPQSGAWRLASPEAREHAVMLLQARAWRSLLPQASLTPLDLAYLYAAPRPAPEACPPATG